MENQIYKGPAAVKGLKSLTTIANKLYHNVKNFNSILFGLKLYRVLIQWNLLWAATLMGRQTSKNKNICITFVQCWTNVKHFGWEPPMRGHLANPQDDILHTNEPPMNSHMSWKATFPVSKGWLLIADSTVYQGECHKWLFLLYQNTYYWDTSYLTFYYKHFIPHNHTQQWNRYQTAKLSDKIIKYSTGFDQLYCELVYQ